MAALYLGEWPCYVLSVDEPHRWVQVRFLGGSAPEGVEPEPLVNWSHLTRPKGARYLDKSPRFTGSRQKPWTGAELRAVWADGTAEGRTTKACEIALYRWWGTKKPGQPMTGRRVGRVLGWDVRRVRLMIASGAIKATRPGAAVGANESWRITDDALYAFLKANPHRYDWRQVEPGTWQERARAIQESDPLLTLREVGHRLGLGTAAVGRRIREGRLPAIETDGGRHASGASNRWLVRQSVVDAIAADLDVYLARRMTA